MQSTELSTFLNNFHLLGFCCEDFFFLPPEKLGEMRLKKKENKVCGVDDETSETTATIPILDVLALQRFAIKENQLLQQEKDNPEYQSFTFSHPPHSIIFLPETRELKVTTGCFQCRDCTIDLVACQHLGHQKPTEDGREGLES
ncbi:hypothetical protein CEXT_482361 [Caerostris extrusa]|uniref:Uncharacterized protein n=1 Tax=Caerostris extrusa TaxID=172846 RepID=A0AAV4P492_CAEEX|nr:hypothetical protein CEXT_482361 [Caerostris extrusa]